MSVGLLVVRFQYGLYVVVHLSKFASLFSVFTRSMSALSCRFTLAANGRRLDAGRIFSGKLQSKNELSIYRKTFNRSRFPAIAANWLL